MVLHNFTVQSFPCQASLAGEAVQLDDIDRPSGVTDGAWDTHDEAALNLSKRDPFEGSKSGKVHSFPSAFPGACEKLGTGAYQTGCIQCVLKINGTADPQGVLS